MFKKSKKRISKCGANKICFWSFFGIFIISLFLYGFFVLNTITDIAERQSMEEHIFVLNDKVLDLEAQYLQAKGEITMQLAYNLGFIENNNHKFVTRKVDNFGLSLRTDN